MKPCEKGVIYLFDADTIKTLIPLPPCQSVFILAFDSKDSSKRVCPKHKEWRKKNLKKGCPNLKRGVQKLKKGVQKVFKTCKKGVQKLKNVWSSVSKQG